MEPCVLDLITRALQEAVVTSGICDTQAQVMPRFLELYIPDAPGLPSYTDETLQRFANDLRLQAERLAFAYARSTAQELAGASASQFHMPEVDLSYPLCQSFVGAVYAFGAVHLAQVRVFGSSHLCYYKLSGAVKRSTPIIRAAICDKKAHQLLTPSRLH